MDQVEHRQVMERVATMQAAPVWEGLSPEARDEFDARFLPGPVAWADVTPADRELIRTGEHQVSAGASSKLVDPVEWGDHAAIDAALDSDDDDALDAALFTVGHGYGVRETWVGSTTPESVAVEVADADSEDWIGL